MNAESKKIQQGASAGISQGFKRTCREGLAIAEDVAAIVYNGLMGQSGMTVPTALFDKDIRSFAMPSHNQVKKLTDHGQRATDGLAQRLHLHTPVHHHHHHHHFASHMAVLEPAHI
ncbi:hypothetical protein [Bifidobacterium mizhiense]|uniref:hypothetical protein n=1 Tax=Bifidobacterium mizhiense TaxID=2879940 RepID=UPI001E38F3B1|nr:hypothetical protein [Bifidobacterium mizhiense]